MRRAGQITAALMTSISKAEAGRRVAFVCYSEEQRAAAEQIACRLLGDGQQVTDHLLTVEAGSVEFVLSGRRPQSDPDYVLYEQVPPKRRPDKSWHYVENSLPGSETQWYTEGYFEGEE